MLQKLFAALRYRLLVPAETIDGFEQPELVDLIFQKTKRFDPPKLDVDMTGVATVLDFGGGCGIHYKAVQPSSVRWAVVETPAMAQRARELATDRLQFFSSISDATAWLGTVDLIYSNAALQYTPDPAAIVRQLCAVRAGRMLWYRAVLSDSSLAHREIQSSYLSENGPGRLFVKEKTIRYERTKIPEAEFLAAHGEYDLVGRGPDAIERGSQWFQFAIRTPAPFSLSCR